jgi:chromosome segregation ATPase
MGMDYEKIKNKKDGNEFWASYSDLFMVLSVVFLLLYVTASMRSGTFSVQKNTENKRLAEEASDLKQQIKVFNTLKEDYLEKDASQKDQEVYKQLMDKLTLLQEENNVEASKLRKQAQENENKEMALNEYQQIIRNIINANMLSQARIKKRDQIIVKNEEVIKEKETEIKQNIETINQQDQELEEQSQIIEQKQKIIAQKKKQLEQKQQEIVLLEQDIDQKEDVIEQNNQQINSINTALNQKIQALKVTQAKHKSSSKKLMEDIEKLKKQEAQKVAMLKNNNAKINQELNKFQNKLKSAEQTISSQEQEKDRLAQELTVAEKNLINTQQSYQEQVNKLQKDHDARLRAERITFEKKLEGEKMSAAEKEARMVAFQKQADARAAELKGKISGLQQKVEMTQQEADARAAELKGKISGLQQKVEMTQQEADARAAELKGKISGLQEKVATTSTALENAKGQQARMVASIDQLKTEKDQLSGTLKEIKDQERAKKQITETIRKNFAAQGVKADINDKTGEVTMSFGKEFFDSGSADLKPAMLKVLRDFIPTYSKSLFQDEKVAEKIKNVEIIGHASPTYKGKFVNPNSLDPKDQKATAFNLDLSIKRAKSIFNEIFDTKKMTYEHQQALRGMIKVTGRGFLADGKDLKKLPNGMKESDFCKSHDCKKAQTVIIKFNLKE